MLEGTRDVVFVVDLDDASAAPEVTRLDYERIAECRTDATELLGTGELAILRRGQPVHAQHALHLTLVAAALNACRRQRRQRVDLRHGLRRRQCPIHHRNYTGGPPAAAADMVSSRGENLVDG